MPTDFSEIPLRDIHLPEAVFWWPPAIGWWLLLLVVILGAILLVRQIYKFRQYKLRTAAVKELKALFTVYQSNQDAKRFARELSVLLRRICISYFPPNRVAGLTGKDWLMFLDSVLVPKQNKSGYRFSESVGAILISGPYQNNLKDKDINVEALYTLSAEWVSSLGPITTTRKQATLLSRRRGESKREASRVSV